MTPGSSVSIKGSLISQSDFYFNGQFEGTIQADQSTVTIGPNGKLLGDVTARQVIVCGVVTGNVSAAERVDLQKISQLDGKVSTARISIEDGACFKGSVDIPRSK